MIRAECHTVDNERSVTFDATPWFEEIDAESIVRLARRNWLSPWVADALESRTGYEPLRELLQYARDKLQRESREDPSWSNFECRVDGAQALAWLAENRPEVAKRLRGG